MSDMHSPGPRVLEEEMPRQERRPGGGGPAVFATDVSERVEGATRERTDGFADRPPP